MNPRLMILALLLLSWPRAAAAEGPYRLKPGATGKLCLECHLTVEEQLDLKSVHTPVRAGDCSDCHNPHSANHGQLLALDPSEICESCHSDILPEGVKSAHQPLVEGSCSTCHDPHASDNENNLQAPGKQLCYNCHPQIEALVEQGQFSHSPARGDCLVCHDPHGSDPSGFLLKQEVGTLCAGCHNTGQPAFVERHMGYPVSDSRCTSCHDPHGSDRSGILLAEVHEPLTNKMCNQCHEDPSSPNALATKESGIELCRGCHNSVLNETFARNRIHWPVADQTGCLNCHSPHASNQQALLRAPTVSLCGSCHQDTVASLSHASSQHQPVIDGDCGSCHSSHGANNPFLLESRDVIDLCGTCHDWRSHSSHPIGSAITDQRNKNLTVDCQSCHRAHGSSFRALSLLDPDGDLCVQCHEEMTR